MYYLIFTKTLYASETCLPSRFRWERQIRSGLANSLFFLRNVLSECLSKQLVPVLLELTNLVDVITVMEARLVRCRMGVGDGWLRL